MPSRSPLSKPLLHDDVQSFLETLEHPLKAEALALREIILEADPSILEGVKWNTLSFRTTEWFATFRLHKRDQVGVILHFSAKKREVSGLEITDPEGLLEWLVPDRAQVMLGNLANIRAQEAAFTKLICTWIKHVGEYRAGRGALEGLWEA